MYVRDFCARVRGLHSSYFQSARRKLIRATGEELRERGEEKREENLFIILESKSHRDKSDFVTCIQKF